MKTKKAVLLISAFVFALSVSANAELKGNVFLMLTAC